MKTTTLSILATAAAAMAFASDALAQTNGTFLLTSSNTVSPATPSTTIEIWATWDDPANQYRFGVADYDLMAGDGTFSNPVNVLNGPGGSTGNIAGNVISGALNGQVLICGFAGCTGSDDNPILIATYDWSTTDFTPRQVDLITSNTTNFIVGERFSLRTVQLFPNTFTPGTGTITVVPSPATWLALGLPLAGASRRRRVIGPDANQG
jgi:hypothetical protein